METWDMLGSGSFMMEVSSAAFEEAVELGQPLSHHCDAIGKTKSSEDAAPKMGHIFGEILNCHHKVKF